MKGMNEPHCGNCRFADYAGRLTCRRYPPTIVPGLMSDETRFPAVSDHWFCGEYQEPITESEADMSPLEMVLSGKHELCIGKTRFIRNAVFRNTDGKFTQSRTIPVTKEQADEIIAHPCVTLGFSGNLEHYYTRAFPVQPKGNR